MFREKPAVFYKNRKIIAWNYCATLFTIHDDQITENGLSFKVKFHGKCYIYSFAINWIAFGK